VYSTQVPSTNPRRPGERAGLNAETVIDTARRMLSDQGADGLSMRRLAAELGVLPNTLYSHVADKQALLDALVDRLLGEVRPAPGRTWQERAAGLLRATRAALLEEPAIAKLYTQRAGRGPGAVRLAQTAMQICLDAGMPPEAAADSFRVMLAYTVGFVAFELSRSGGGGVAPLPEQLGLGAYAGSPGDVDFERGMAWLMAGLTSELRAAGIPA
jgi:TetR/AcrR family tetracycline transcriptional repressor